MNDRDSGRRTAIDQIEWSSFPKSAQRFIRETLEEISLENTDNPDRGNTLRKAISASIGKISRDRSRYSSNMSLGVAILEEAEARRNFNTGRLDAVGRQLETLGQSLLELRVAHGFSRS